MYSGTRGLQPGDHPGEKSREERNEEDEEKDGPIHSELEPVGRIGRHDCSGERRDSYRMPSSRIRMAVLARRRFATFMHATESTRKTAKSPMYMTTAVSSSMYARV